MMQSFLATETWPPWMRKAALDVGVRELPGIATHKRITEFYSHTNLTRQPEKLDDSETSWCAAAMCCWLEESGYRSPRSAKARSFLGYGEPLQRPKLGCIVVFSRGDPAGQQGHVALYVEPAPNSRLWVLGGNQGNSVRYSNSYELARVLGYRWPTEQL
jgi:uncharacterized protein (TIGR02594 family)